MTDDPGSYALTRFNATSHGILARCTVLPWESGEEYGQLLAALTEEHQPCGPTEEHLVGEIAGVIWRKRRLRMAEGAAHRSRLRQTFAPYGDTASSAVAHLGQTGDGEQVAEAVRAGDAATAEAIADVDEDTAMTRSALALLGTKGKGALQEALAALREDTRGWWEGILADGGQGHDRDGHRYAADVGSLERFLDDEVMPWLIKARARLVNRPLIREQAWGESLDANQLERLGRYEVHLDRKLERMLAMLYRLKELRRPQVEEG
jgi:hypothetical protein